MTSPPKYKLRWSVQAERDVEAVADRIARQNPKAANEWIERIIRHVEDASAIPLAGRVVPELNRPELRETFLGRYRVVYRIDLRTVTVVTVFAGERDGWPREEDPDAT
jgi:toxin ParE1/3/4